MSRIAGPKPNNSVDQGFAASLIGSALISTPFSIRNCSRLGPTNAGSVVTKLLDVRGGPRPGAPFGCTSLGGSGLPSAAGVGDGYVIGCAKRPVSVSPRL